MALISPIASFVLEIPRCKSRGPSLLTGCGFSSPQLSQLGSPARLPALDRVEAGERPEAQARPSVSTPDAEGNLPLSPNHPSATSDRGAA